MVAIQPSPPSTPALKRIHQAAVRLFADKGSTEVNISELAHAAGVARGTVYNNLSEPDSLFEEVAAQLSSEMHQRIVASFVLDDDPAQRLANGIRYFIRRAHEEPDWGRFFCRFAMGNASLRELWNGPPMMELLNGLQQGRYQFRQEQLPGMLAMMAGSVLGSMLLVLEGHRTWRDAGADNAELLLRAIGVPIEEARALASTELPPLPSLD